MEEWDLQAVVRGVSGSSSTDQFTTTSSTTTNPDSCFSPFFDFEFDQQLLFSFPDLFQTTNELEQLYKPFCHSTSSGSTTLSPQTMAPSSISDVPIEVIKEEEEDRMNPLFRSPLVTTTDAPSPTVARGPKHKTRKNQQKKVVLHVTADGLSSDLWAWRKYGQKPIKGSPYPRSYYRCSSSKGCLARRQVEQSCTNSGMYIITYTAEHNHAQPTRRNSLAGINRHKFGTLKSHAICDTITTKSSNDSPILSPLTPPLNSPVEEELRLQQHIKEERRDTDDDQEQTIGESDDNEFVIPDIMLTDDFFADLVNLDEVTSSDLSFRNRSTKQFPVSFCS